MGSGGPGRIVDLSCRPILRRILRRSHARRLPALSGAIPPPHPCTAPSELSAANEGALRKAFRERNRAWATEIALSIYGVNITELEKALGH